MEPDDDEGSELGTRLARNKRVRIETKKIDFEMRECLIEKVFDEEQERYVKHHLGKHVG